MPGQLASILREKIRSGEWPSGHELPSLDELSEQYGVARVTARQATQVLMGEGLVSSARGVGMSTMPLGPSTRMKAKARMMDGTNIGRMASACT